MILDTMSFSEKRREYMRDFEANVLPAYLHCFGKKEKFERIARKHSSDKKLSFKPVEYDSKGKNHYINYFSVNGKNGYRKEGIKGNTIMTYRTAGGEKAVMTVNEDLATFWGQHFFERYRERGLKDMSLSLDDTINIFFTALGYVTVQDVDSEKYKNNVYALLDNGLMLGEDISDNEMTMIYYHTFISNEMLKGDQYSELASLIFHSQRDTNNDYRPDSIKKYEERHKDSLLFYGRPIVVKGCNDEPYSLYNAKRFENHKEAIEEFVRLRMTFDYYEEYEAKRVKIWNNYVKNQKKKGNTDQMCSAPIVIHTPSGMDIMAYKMTTYHSDFEELLVAAPYIVDGDVYLVFRFEAATDRFITMAFKLQVIEKFRNQHEEIKEWSAIEAFLPFSRFLEIKAIYFGEDDRILADSPFGQFSCKVVEQTICFEELNEAGKYARARNYEEVFSWIRK